MQRKVWSLLLSVVLLISFFFEAKKSIFWITVGTIVVLIDLYDLFKTKEKMNKLKILRMRKSSSKS